jgi:hypothetical protein
MLAQFGRVPSLCSCLGLAAVFYVRMVAGPKKLTITYLDYGIFHAEFASFF